MKIDSISEGDSRVSFVGRARSINSNHSEMTIVDDTGGVVVHVPLSDSEGMKQISRGDVCSVVGVVIEGENAQPFVQAEILEFEYSGELMDRFKPGLLPHRIARRLGWAESVAEVVDDSDGSWIEECWYETRPWWDGRKLAAIIRTDFIYEWEMENGGVPGYVTRRIEGSI